MKTLYLLRHAKSSWSNASLSDHQRPLNTRGQSDIPKMAAWLAKKLDRPNKVISSDSTRTRLTIQPVQHAWAIPDGFIEFTRKIFHASASQLLNLIKECPANINTLMLVGHNPGLTELTNQLATNYITDNIPTSGFVALQFKVDNWRKIERGQGQFLAYQYPKNL